jgi:zinc transport system substrate-binding protein
MNKKILLVVVSLVIVIIVSVLAQGRARIDTSEDTSKIAIVTSFYPLYFLIGEIGGDKINLVNITPTGVEPHEYEPRSLDIALMENSDVIILNGGGLEPWGERIQKNIDASSTIIVNASEGLISRNVVENEKTIRDPHIWLSPTLVSKMVDTIVLALEKADAPNTDYYETNARSLKTRLEALSSEFSQGLSSCKRKDFITSHAAFGYLAEEFNLNQVAIAGLSPESEPSVKELAEITTFAKANGVKYIFFESLVSPKLSQTVAREVGAQTLVLNPIEGLRAADISAGKDYFSEMRNNLANLRLALECSK